MKHFFSALGFSAFAFLAVGFFQKPAAPKPETVFEKAVSPAAQPPVFGQNFWVDGSDFFYKNDLIELRFAPPNAPFLGVLDPSGHFFYLVYPAENASGGLRPMAESADFEGLSRLEIAPDSFRADSYQFEVSENQPVFTRSGKYTFILGQNLHVDDPAELDQLVIEYIHQNRPAEKTVAMR